jgi:hypothetical protein
VQFSADCNNFNLNIKCAEHSLTLGIKNELSWTVLGEHNKQQRQLQMEKAALCMQRFFRSKFRHKLTKSSNVIDSGHPHITL